MEVEKFAEGDLVWIKDDLGQYKSHFTSGVEAIVEYRRDYRGGCDYTLYIKGEGGVSWYDHSELTLVKKNQHELKKEWKEEMRIFSETLSDLDWIFSNHKEVLSEKYVSSAKALADCMGFSGDFWGNSGEGYCFHMNVEYILDLSRQYLEGNKKREFLEACDEIKTKYKTLKLPYL